MVEALWIGERLEALQRLAVIEKLSARQISDRIEGATRNSVMGACRRHGITLGGRKANPVWTSERLELLKNLVAEGLSSAEIALRLGCGKGSVVRACHRYNVRLVIKHGTHKSNRRRAVLAPLFDKCRNVTFAELADRDCKFPTADDSPFFFCGLPRMSGSSYCVHHHLLCHQQARNEREAA